MKSDHYEYISGPEQLNQFYQHGTVISKRIQFVSILTKITFKPNDKCLLHFDNYTNGKEGLHTYIGKIKNSNEETDMLIRMVLSLLLPKLGIDSKHIDYSEEFEQKDLQYRKLSIFNIRGVFKTAYDNASLKIMEFDAIDLNKFFNNPTSDEYNMFKPTLDKLFNNLLKQEKRNSSFRLAKLSNYSHSMKKYMEQLNSKKNALNPIFHIGLLNNFGVDSINDFNSQTQTQDEADSQLYIENNKESSNNADGSPSCSSDLIDFEASEDGDSSISEISAQQEPYGQIKLHEVATNKRKKSPEDTNKKSNKKIRLTNLGALNDKVSSKESTVISSFQLPLESNGSVYESELEKLDNTKSYHSYFMINPQSINSIMAGKNVLLRNVRILGTLPNCFNDMKVTIDEDELVLYAYSYDLPIHNTTFTPELNCYEVTVTDISLFSQGLGISKHLINKDGLKIISALFSKNKYDITITKEQYDIGHIKSYRWTLKNITFNSVIEMPNTVESPHNKFPLVTVSEIKANNGPSYYTVFALAVTTKYSGGKTVVLSFTDLTSNSLSSYGYDSFLGSFYQRLPEDQHIHALLYLNRVETVNSKLRDVITMNLKDCPDKGNSNITHRCIIFRFTIKCQMFKGKLNTVILDADPITPTTSLTAKEYSFVKPLRERIFDQLSAEVLELYKLTISRFLPIQKSTRGRGFELIQDEDIVPQNQRSTTSIDPIRMLETSADAMDHDSISRLDIRYPVNIHDTRIHNPVSIKQLKTQIDNQHTDNILNIKLLNVQELPDRLILYGTESHISEDTIENPLDDLLKIQIWGSDNLSLFFNDNQYMKTKHDFTRCIGGSIKLSLIPRKIKVSKYLYVKTWAPVYITYESLLLHRKLQFEEVWKEEDISGLQ